MDDQQQLASMPDEFAGRFQCRATLGQGAMGIVFRAFDQARRHDVALKLLHRARPEDLYRFKQEFRQFAELVHPNVVTLYELIAHDGRWGLAMELVNGARSFLDYVRPYSHLVARPLGLASSILATDSASAVESEPWESVALATVTGATQTSTGLASGASSAWDTTVLRPSRHRGAIAAAELNPHRLRTALLEFAQGLTVIHGSGMLHRDLKPSNVLVDDTGRVVVCDFGLVVGAGEASDAAGTPAYMSPEQTDGAQLTAASDMYSVGVMLYQALTGILPTTGATIGELQANKRNAPERTPRELVPEVDAQLDALCTALLDPDPMQRPRAIAIVTQLQGHAPHALQPRVALGAGDEVRFVGRTEERKRLNQALDDARSGRSVGVFVSGPSGFGKSSLVAATCADMQSRTGALVLAGRCYQTESVPFKALDAVIDELAHHLATLEQSRVEALIPDDIGAVCELFPVLRRVHAIAVAVRRGDRAIPAHLIRPRAQIALRRLMFALARDTPLVFVIDDLQWGDRDSEPFLREIIEASDSPGVLLIATCRSNADGDVPASPLLDTLQDESVLGARDLRWLTLSPLSPAEARELVESIPHARTHDAIERLLADAGGHPLFLAELAHLAEAFPFASGVGDLDQLLQHRIEALSPEARKLLSAAAVAIRPQPLSLLSRALELQGEAAALTELRAGRMAKVIGGRDGDLLTTYHARVGDTAANLLDERARRRLHRRLARAFESAPVLDLEALAMHWAGAGEVARSGHYATRAAEGAMANQAYHRAATHYERALLVRELSPDNRFELQAARARALYLAGAVDQAAIAFNQVAETAPPDQVPQLRAQALICLLRSGDLAAANTLAHAFGAEIGVKIPRSKIAALSSIAWHRLRLAVRRPKVRRLRDPKQIAAPILSKLTVAKHVSNALGLTDTLPGFSVHTRYLLDALRTGSPRHLVLALGVEALFLSALRGQRAVDHIDAILREAQRAAAASGSDRYVALAVGCGGMVDYIRMRRCHDAANSLEVALACIEQEPELSWEADVGRLYLINSYARAGAIAKVADTLPGLIKRARAAGNEYLRAQLSRQVGVQAYIALDEPARALELLESARPQDGDRVSLFAYFYQTNRAEAEAYTGDWASGADRVDGLWQAIRDTSMGRVGITRCWTAYSHCRLGAVAALAAGESAASVTRKAQPLLAELMRLRRKLPNVSTGLAAQLRGILAFADGDQAACVQHLQTALTGFERCQADFNAMPTRYQLGRLTGGEQGTSAMDTARRWAAEQRIPSMERFADWACPLPSSRATTRSKKLDTVQTQSPRKEKSV